MPDQPRAAQMVADTDGTTTGDDAMPKREMTVNVRDLPAFKEVLQENERLRAELRCFARADGYIVTGPNGTIEGFDVYVRLPQEEPTDG